MRNRRSLDQFLDRFPGRQGRPHVQQRNVVILAEISRHHEGIGQIQVGSLHIVQRQLVTIRQLAQQGIEVCRLARHGIGPGIQIGLLAGGFVLVLGLKGAVAQQVVLPTSEVLIPQGIRRTDRVAVQGGQIGHRHVGLAMAGVVQEAFQRLAQIAFGHRPGDAGKVVALRETVRPRGRLRTGRQGVVQRRHLQRGQLRCMHLRHGQRVGLALQIQQGQRLGLFFVRLRSHRCRLNGRLGSRLGH